MKLRNLLLAGLLASASVPASAASLGVSVGFNQPGLHGTIHVGDFYRPRVTYARPVVVYPQPVVIGYQPVYGYGGYRGRGHWKQERHHRHCRH